MSDTSPRLALPFLAPSQAQKHVTVNEALSRLDMLVQLSVEGIGTADPPAAPAPGEAHVVGAGATGAWAGQDGALAAWDGAAWVFVAPLPGWRAWNAAEGALRVWTGTAWVLPKADIADPALLGINATADATNRLAVSAAATLLSHEGAGHQVKVNKAAPGDTAALLFQSAWSGRAEIGLAGEDALSVKVSADGSAWVTALRIDPVSGAMRPAVHAAGALPDAAAAGEGALIHVAGQGPAWSDGTAWRYVSDNSAV